MASRYLVASVCALLACLPAARSARAEPGKALAPIPPATLALMLAKGTDPHAPVLFRAYKKEAEIEVWKRAGDGRYVFLKTFPICRWSGQLGPKRRAGDRQVPEGFYSVPRAKMNPNSHYYLSFDVGYPNAYDRAHGATGSAIMVHGICSSMGCFAMTDRGVGEIYAIAREALAGGQTAFQFQSFPFRMSAANMARYRSDPNIAFWRELKEGSDRFEATGEPPTVSVVAGRYAFAPLADPVREIAAQSRVREEAERARTLVADGAAAVRTTYADGAQHPMFVSLAARGTALGEVSRPEALAFAGQEIVLIQARRKPPAGLADLATQDVMRAAFPAGTTGLSVLALMGPEVDLSAFAAPEPPRTVFAGFDGSGPMRPTPIFLAERRLAGALGF